VSKTPLRICPDKYTIKQGRLTMGLQGVHLREFKEEELLLDEEETRRVLIYFFPNEKAQINAIEITNQLRSFAQALMVEAIDASYAIGWLDLTKDFIKPRPTPDDIKKAIGKMLKKAARYWFKHLKGNNFLESDIYEVVRKQLSISFRQTFIIMIQAKVDGIGGSNRFAFIDYQRRI
jgi:hypothetical protein